MEWDNNIALGVLREAVPAFGSVLVLGYIVCVTLIKWKR